VCEADTKNLGVETKVEVNAANGKMIEVSTEAWEIGKEADEKKINDISPIQRLPGPEIPRITLANF